MDSELTNIAAVKALDQGVATTDSPTFAAITVTGNVDGRDVSVDGAKLDTIETNADVTDTANVTAAGALMDSELTSITAVKALDQGVATTDSPAFSKVSTGDGTAAAPAIIFTNDTNTGLYRRTTDELNVSVGGTEYWRFNGERGNFAAASTISLTAASYTDMVTVNFTARSQSALIVADATYNSANAATYVYSYIETTLGNSNAAYGYLGTTIAEEFTTLSNSAQIHGLTVGTSYTVNLKAIKSNSGDTAAQCLIASIGVFN